MSFGILWPDGKLLWRGTADQAVSAYGDIWQRSIATKQEEHAITTGQQLRSPIMIGTRRVIALSANGFVDVDPAAKIAKGSKREKAPERRSSAIEVGKIARLLAYKDGALLALTADGCLLKLADSNLEQLDKACGMTESEVAIAQRQARTCGAMVLAERVEGDPAHRIDIALFRGRLSTNLTRTRKERRNTDASFAPDCSSVLYVSARYITE